MAGVKVSLGTFSKASNEVTDSSLREIIRVHPKKNIKDYRFNHQFVSEWKIRKEMNNKFTKQNLLEKKIFIEYNHIYNVLIIFDIVSTIFSQSTLPPTY